MTTLTRYILAELLKVFLVTLGGMTVFMLIVGLAQEAIRMGLGPEPIVKLIPFAIPNALRFAIPGTMLFAACSVYGRMASSNEVVALKSLGVSPVRVVIPAFALAFVVSLSAVWINDLAVSWGRRGMERVVLHSLEQIIYGVLRTERTYTTSRFSVNVKAVEDRILLRPTINFHGSGDKPDIYLTAEKAELRLDQELGVLTILLTNGEVTVDDKATARFPNTIERVIPLTEATSGGGGSGSPSSYPMWLLKPEEVTQREEIAQLKEQYAVDAAFDLLTGELEQLASPDWQNRQRSLDAAYARLHRLETEPWRRWANGFSCLFFVVVGAPLSIRLRNSDLWTTFATVFLPTLVVYYPLLAYGVDRAKAGDVPPATVWLGNIILGLAGIWLLRKIIRY